MDILISGVNYEVYMDFLKVSPEYRGGLISGVLIRGSSIYSTRSNSIEYPNFENTEMAIFLFVVFWKMASHSNNYE